MNKIRPTKFEVIIFLILLLLAAAFFIFFKTIDNHYKALTPIDVNTSESDALTVAYNQGIIMSAINILDSTNNCQVASINYLNKSRRLVDLDCVRILLQQQNITLKGGE